MTTTVLKEREYLNGLSRYISKNPVVLDFSERSMLEKTHLIKFKSVNGKLEPGNISLTVAKPLI